MRRTGTAVALAVLGRAALAGPTGPEELARLKEDAREALRPSCGRCHDHGQPTARPAALRIFDLQEADWSARVTDEQMDHMVGRFESFKMPQADRVTVQRFLDAERARRASAPPAAGPEP